MNIQELKTKLRPDSYDWLVSAVDPFHDFEHPIEGAPDACLGRSFTRKFTQTSTISAAAEDDNISLFFTGCHGGSDAMFYSWGPDGYCDALAAGVSLYPIMVLRNAVGTQPNFTRYCAGTSTSLGGFTTRQVATVPSRLVSIGVEITDTTQALYRRGTLAVAHANATAVDGFYTTADVAPVPVHFFQPSPMPCTMTPLMAHGGAYIGPAAKGVYVQGRMNAIQPPVAGRYTTSNNTTYGFPGKHPLLAENVGTGTNLNLIAPTVNNGDALTGANFNVRNTWSDSGFAPFVIQMMGLSVESTFQITVKTTVEYFPTCQFSFELGLATYSPAYDPEAFRIYHEVMRQIPAGVPVSMNAAGDFWRMIVTAARRVMAAGAKYGPAVLKAVETAASVAGHPELAAAARAAGYGVAAMKVAALTKRANKITPAKRKK